MNHLKLVAKITQKSLLRYTPNGLPAIDLVLEHESKLADAGVIRDVGLVLKALAFGANAEVLLKVAVGQVGEFSGFLNNARGGKGTLFHIQNFHPINNH